MSSLITINRPVKSAGLAKRQPHTGTAFVFVTIFWTLFSKKKSALGKSNSNGECWWCNCHPQTDCRNIDQLFQAKSRTSSSPTTTIWSTICVGIFERRLNVALTFENKNGSNHARKNAYYISHTGVSVIEWVRVCAVCCVAVRLCMSGSVMPLSNWLVPNFFRIALLLAPRQESFWQRLTLDLPILCVCAVLTSPPQW